MSQSCDGSSSSRIRQDSSSDDSRSRKRRRLNRLAQTNDLHDSLSEDELASSVKSPASHSKDGSPEKNDDKPKPRFRIHIPKNADIPLDAFLTQPPERSSSPYRFEPFVWQKPPRPSPAPERLITPQSLNPHVSTTSAPASVSRVTANSDAFDIDQDDEDFLADIPSDAFDSPNVKNQGQVRPDDSPADLRASPSGGQRRAAPRANLQQTTLFGTQAAPIASQTQSKRKPNFPLANRKEPPTHHELDRDSMETWVYPTNLGTIRDYQFSIVAKGLYHNMLVALPTGLGKTFIAATIMLNWYRWTKNAQIVFAAPTRPLVSQQIKACFEIAGIPRSDTTMLTGNTPPGLRAEEWRSKRVFFMTPQTLINDLKTGICDSKKLVLIVVDEAHRATGNYAYVEVITFVKRFNTSFRVLALTATPGSSIEGVQEVIDGLGMARIEIRTEESLDIRQYVHARKIDTVLFDNSDEMVMIMDLFSKALQPAVNKLTGMNAYWNKDPMTLTPYGCTQARIRWAATDAGKKAPWPVKAMVMNIFSLLASLSHAIELLKFHGIGPFYRKVLEFRNTLHAGGKKGGKDGNLINEHPDFQSMMSRVQLWINTPDFLGHPKLEYLQSVVMNHFLDAGEGRGPTDPSSTRIMIFSHYRDSAEEIARVLRRNEPMVRPHVFVGQSNTKGSDGMDQKTQLELINKFKTGIYNTIVATSIGEEGLDIGEVDLIICYDASASPIRMLQRMGRTGRKRAGNIVVTLMRGKEENNFIKAKDNYEKMQVEIASGVRFTFHDEDSRRIVPKEIQPVVDKRMIEIPPENTQADLPEPTRRGRPPKRPPKKFQMPDNVRTGFTKASRMYRDEEDDESDGVTRKQKHKPVRPPSPILVPELSEVLLTSADQAKFERHYLDIKGDFSQTVEVPRVDAFSSLQRVTRPTKHVEHSLITKRFVQTMNCIARSSEESSASYEQTLDEDAKLQGQTQAAKRARYVEELIARTPKTSIQMSDTTRASPSSSFQSKDLVKDSLSKVTDNANDSSSPINLESDDAFSSTSSPPLPVEHVEPFYRSQKKDDEVSECGEELPDLGDLVQKENVPQGKALSRGRGARTRVLEDSDDE